jgi:hypothetical protein
MAFVNIDKEKLGMANKYANLIRNKGKRDYARSVIRYWKNGGEHGN